MPRVAPCLSASCPAVMSSLLSCPAMDLHDKDSWLGCSRTADGASAEPLVGMGRAGKLVAVLRNCACSHTDMVLIDAMTVVLAHCTRKSLQNGV